MPPGTTPKVASRAGRPIERESDASHLSALGPAIATRVSPPLGSRSSSATSQRASRNRVGPTVSVTGPERAVRAAIAASPS